MSLESLFFQEDGEKNPIIDKQGLRSGTMILKMISSMDYRLQRAKQSLTTQDFVKGKRVFKTVRCNKER